MRGSFLTFVVCIGMFSQSGAAIVQIEDDYIAFQAELGTLNDGTSNGDKFDLMAPAANSFGAILRSTPTPGGEVSFEVEFSNPNGGVNYGTFVRYRELSGGVTPEIRLNFEGTDITPTSMINTGLNPNFEWFHLPDMDFVPVAGVAQTFTFSALDSDEWEIDAIAFVKESVYNSGGGFVVGDVNDSYLLTFSIPEPGTTTLMLFGSLLFLRRRTR